MYYVAKGDTAQKGPEEETQQQEQKQQKQQQPREDRPQQSRGKGGYEKGDYNKDRDRGYNQNSGKYKEYTKKDNYKKTTGGTTGGNRGQDVYYEYVPK